MKKLLKFLRRDSVKMLDNVLFCKKYGDRWISNIPVSEYGRYALELLDGTDVRITCLRHVTATILSEYDLAIELRHEDFDSVVNKLRVKDGSIITVHFNKDLGDDCDAIADVISERLLGGRNMFIYRDLTMKMFDVVNTNRRYEKIVDAILPDDGHCKIYHGPMIPLCNLGNYFHLYYTHLVDLNRKIGDSRLVLRADVGMQYKRRKREYATIYDMVMAMDIRENITINDVSTLKIG